MGSRRPLRGTALLLAASVGSMGAIGSGLVQAQPVAAAGGGAFSAVASASTFRMLFGSPGRFAVDYYIDGGSPVSQALVNSVGTSTAFASAPYPGETAVVGPGTVSGVTGLPNPGDYPFFVRSVFPAAPDGEASFPGLSLKAHSEGGLSAASAASGGSGPGASVLEAKSDSTAAREDSGTVTAQALSESSGIAVGDVLRIAAVSATASVTRSTDDDLAREATFEATGISIAGQAVGLSEKGFTVAGTDTPLPDSSPLTQALSEGGIAVQYLQAKETQEGIVSPGLMITQTSAAPDGGPGFAFQVVLGQAVAYVTSSVVSGVPGPSPQSEPEPADLDSAVLISASEPDTSAASLTSPYLVLVLAGFLTVAVAAPVRRRGTRSH